MAIAVAFVAGGDLFVADPIAVYRGLQASPQFPSVTIRDVLTYGVKSDSIKSISSVLY